MAEQLPDWRAGFLEAHGLAPEYLASAQKWFDPMGVPTNVLLEAAFAIQALPE